jgi:hypothetical protein
MDRRDFFSWMRDGLAGAAAASLMLRDGTVRGSEAGEGLPAGPHFAPRATRAIHICLCGAMSQVDTFDYKPGLFKAHGQSLVSPTKPDVFFGQVGRLRRPDWDFKQRGDSGLWISDLFPNLGGVADELTVIRSMIAETSNHTPATFQENSGFRLNGFPSLGAWMSYGLGSEADDLPGFVVLSSAGGSSGGAANWGCGFLPTAYQGVSFRSKGDPILNVSNPAGVDAGLQRDTLDLVGRLNRDHLADAGDPEITTRIAAYELAYKMQTSAPELMDVSGERKETLELYGAEPGKPSFANNCLLARRLVERGVRFVNLFHEGWDHHSDVAGGLKSQCGQTDRAAAALVTDLKRRGLLEDTLVIWGGEFGRTPMVESNASLGRSMGRDHHPQAFTMWMAGGGIKAGVTLGATDELGFHIVESPVHVHDLQATILHLLGLDHTRLTYRHQGRNFRLTDVHGEVVNSILA